MSVSRMTIEPWSGFRSPISDFRNTDLPVPDGPSSTETSPGGSVRVTSFQMICRPKDLVSSWTATSTPTGRSLLTMTQTDFTQSGTATAVTTLNDQETRW